MRGSSLAIAVAVAALVAGVLVLGHHRGGIPHSPLDVRIAGGDGGGLPLAQPGDEHFDVVALERGRADPAAAGLVAWLVMRHGHLVSEHYSHGLGRDSPVDFGPAARSLVALLAGALVADRALNIDELGAFDANGWKQAIERSAQRPYIELLSRRVWSRLNAAPAWIELPALGAAVPADCCLHARLQDWLRIGALLSDQGSFEGTQIVSPDWAARVLTQGLGVEPPTSAHGASPFAIDDMAFLRGQGRWRLWLSPSLHLVVLFGSVAGATATGSARHDNWDETRLPNLVVEAITDLSSAQKGESLLQQLVPHH